MKHPGVDGRRHQVIGCCDGMNVTRQVEVKLETQKKVKAW